jgi:hypothetical protein
LEDEIKQILDSNKVKKYTNQQVYDFLSAYILSGNIMASAKNSGVEWGAAKEWVKTKWARTAMELMRGEAQQHLDHRLTGLIEKSVDELEDRLTKGDVVAGGKRQKIKAVNVATILGVLYEKRALIRGEPTSRVERVTTDQRLRELTKRFESMPNTKYGKLIEAQEVPVEEIEDETDVAESETQATEIQG